MTKEQKEIAVDAIREIRSLRRENELLRARVETMELFAVVLNTKPSYREHGASIDVAWKLEQEIEK